MTNDPMQQADIERRLTNLAKARRCGARTRAGHPCKQAAVTGRARCRMHGGANGSGGPRGDRNGHFRHGLWTFETIAMRTDMRLKLGEVRALVCEVKSLDAPRSTAQVRPVLAVKRFVSAGAPAMLGSDSSARTSSLAGPLPAAC